MSTIALNFQHNFGIRAYTHQVNHLLPVAERLTIQRQQAVAGFQTCGLSRPLRIELGKHRRQRRTPWTDAQRLDWIRLIGTLKPAIQRQFARRFSGGVLIAHHDIDRATLTQTTHQAKIDIAPTHGGLAINGYNFLPGSQPSLGRNAANFDSTDDGTHLLATDHGQDPEKHHRQQKVGDRAGGNNGDTLTDGLAIERLVQLICRYFAFALIEHLDVTTQRDGCNHELGATAVVPAQQRHAETDGKAQDLDAATTRHPKVAEFVEGDQHTQSNQGADNHVERTHLISPHSNPVPEGANLPTD